VLNKARIFAVLITTFLIVGVSQSAYGAQLSVNINPDNPVSQFEMKYQKTIFLEYEDGGDIADLLRGEKATIEFVADKSNPGVGNLMKLLTQKLASDGSQTKIFNLVVDYSAVLTGRGTNTSLDYKVVLDGDLSGYTIRERLSQNPALIDMAWRGMSVNGPIMINGHEINMPISAIIEFAPQVARAMEGSEAYSLLSNAIIDAEGIKNQPLTNWHFLFDPTGITSDAATFGIAEELQGFVVSGFTMGESSFREGIQVERIFEATFTSDKPYTVRTIQSSDTATVRVIGFAVIDSLDGNEIFGVTQRSPEGYATTSTGEFPVMIMYGMAGMGVLGGGIFFLVSSRKLKKDLGKGQTGIDPSRLKAFDTSASSGGYKTVRGEAQLIDDSEYHKTRNVYDEQKPETKPSESKSGKGALPKGWKPE